jgi:3-phosphoshikimate 1-carboxyvinyltransferase
MSELKKVKIDKSFLSGDYYAVPSKSESHRAIIAASLANGVSYINNIALSQDVLATIKCMMKLGAEITVKDKSLVIRGTSSKHLIEDLDCVESGSTLRFLMPIAAALGTTATFLGQGNLPHRPIVDYLTVFRKHNIDVKTHGGLPLTIKGQLTSGKYEIKGNISSQYISGLLMALPLLKGDSEIILTTPLQSANYVDMTLKTLSQFGIKIEKTKKGYFVKGGQEYIPFDATIEGDWSQGAFFLVGGAINGDIKVHGLNLDSVQADRTIFDIIKDFGGDISVSDDVISVKKSALKGTTVDCENIPDIVPIISLLGANAEGLTTLKGIERLRYKESDRVEGIINGLRAIGYLCGENEDSIEISGYKVHSKKEVIKGQNDHRIVMTFAIAGSLDGDVVITDKNAINKSYPNFFEHFEKLGGKYEFI